MELNFQQLSNATHTISSVPISYNDSGQEWNESTIPPAQSVPLKENAIQTSNTILDLSPSTEVIMQREWVTGNSSWAYIKVFSSGVEGYVKTSNLKPISTLSNSILPKAEVTVTAYNKMARVIFESLPWTEREFPSLYEGNGEWWVTVTLPYTCIDEGTLPELKEEAKAAAINQMYEFFSLPKQGQGNVISTGQFYNGLLSSYVKEYYLSTRPGSNLMMLVVIPAVYIEYLKQNNPLSEPAVEVNEDLCVSLVANSIDDLDELQSNIKECYKKYFLKYMNSNIKVKNFSFENEIFQQLEAINKIKFLLKQNNINLESKENKKASSDPCEKNQANSTIKVCFDSNYKLLSVHYINNSGQEKVLSSGINMVKNSSPFNEPRFGYLFLKQEDVCAEGITLKQFFDEYVIDPVPSTTSVSWTEKSQENMTPIVSERLGIYLETSLFLTAIAKEFGNLFDLKQSEQLVGCFGDPENQRMLDAFRLRASEYRDSQFLYSSDIVGIAAWICTFGGNEEIKLPGIPKGGGGGKKNDNDEIDWDDIAEWAFGADWGDWWSDIDFGDWRLPSFSFLDIIYDLTIGQIEDLVSLIKNQFIKFFATLWCEILVTAAIAGAVVGTGLAGAALYAGYKDDEGNSAVPNPLITAPLDYGAENCNNLISQSIGSTSDQEYDENLTIIFKNCGAPVDAKTARDYLDGISLITSPVEILALFDGTARPSLANVVLKYTQNNFPTIAQYKNTSSKIVEMFVCLGGNVSDKIKQKVQQDIYNKISNPDNCVDICEELKKKMKEKCPDPEVYNSICDKEFNSKIEKYQEIISLISDNCTIQPKLFNNKETGEKGILSSIKNKPANHDLVVDSLTKVTLDPSREIAKSESSQYFLNYEAPLQSLSEKLISTNLIETNPSGKIYQNTWFSLNSDKYPLISLLNDGSERILNLSMDDSASLQVAVGPKKLNPSIEAIMVSDSNYNKANTTLSLSRQQILFYSLIQNYFKNNSKDGKGDLHPSPVPYSITEDSLPNTLTSYQDRLFSLIYEQMIERYAKVVGYLWQGDQSTILEAYSNALQQNIENIIDYEGAKKLISDYYDTGDYDDPTNSETKSTSQVSLMNGILHTYIRMQILEYFAVSMPFYDGFDPYDGDLTQLGVLIREVVEPYISERIREELSAAEYTSLVSYSNEAYKYAIEKSDMNLPKYTGETRGLEFYIGYNLHDVYDKFKSALASSNISKPKSFIESGKFIFDRNTSFPVHDYAGLRTLTTLAGNYLYDVNYSEVDNLSNRSYSLFKDNRYNYFKNGMFFIQNYFLIEDNNLLLLARDNYLQGAVNANQLKKINAFLNPSTKDLPLKEIFKNVKYGSRLCYGIAYDDADKSDSIDPKVKKFAQDFFVNYIIDNGLYPNSKKLSDSLLEASTKSCQFQKNTICLDGSSVIFTDIGPQKKIENISENLRPKHVHTPDGTFSVVIPVISPVETMVDMDLTWKEFYKNIPDTSIVANLSDIEEFKNLNDQLINGEEYKTLVSACFNLQNMVHFNAFSGLVLGDYNDEKVKNSFRTTKQAMFSSLVATANSKKTSQGN